MESRTSGMPRSPRCAPGALHVRMGVTGWRRLGTVTRERWLNVRCARRARRKDPIARTMMLSWPTDLALGVSGVHEEWMGHTYD